MAIFLSVLTLITWGLITYVWYRIGVLRGERKFLQAIGYFINKLKDDMDEGKIDKDTFHDLEHKALFDIFAMGTSDDKVATYAKMYQMQRKGGDNATTRSADDFNQA